MPEKIKTIKKPKISIVIRCFNEEKHIGRLLTGIAEQIEKRIEVILVDSGSTDATLSIASRFPVKILSINKKDFSFGKSLNLGCKKAKGEIIVIASAHVYPVYKDWLRQLVKSFTDSKVGLVYGKQRGNLTTKFSEHQVFARWFPNKSKPDQDFVFCNNANAAIRQSLWKKIKYDEKLTGLEDIDWAKKIKQAGYKIAYTAEAEVIHVHDETYKAIFNRYRREAIVYKKVFPGENFSLIDFIKLYSANVLSDSYKAWKSKSLTTHWLSILAFRLMQFWGTYIGYNKKERISQTLRQTFYYPNIRDGTKKSSRRTREKKTINYSDKIS